MRTYRLFKFTSQSTAIVIIAASCLLLLGCSSTADHQDANLPRSSISTDDISTKQSSTDDVMTLAAQTQARVLLEAMNEEKPMQQPPRVVWIDTNRPIGRSIAQSSQSQEDTLPEVGLVQKSINPHTPGSTSKGKTYPSMAADKMPPLVTNRIDAIPVTRKEQTLDALSLLTQLRAQIHDDQSSSAVSRALKQTILGVLEGRQDKNSQLLDDLDVGQREMIQGYAQILTSLQARVLEGMPSDQWQKTESLIRELVENDSLRIHELKLCTRVEGFGMYDELADRTLLAGREHPMIIYVELNGFSTTVREDGQHEVRLSKEVLLHNEADDLVVWHQPKATVIDYSRSRRRDFFLVQLVRLPEQLSVGKYLLKVRVTDQSNQNVDESVVRLEVVADRSLAAGMTDK